MVMQSGCEKLMVLECGYQPVVLEAQCQAFFWHKIHS